MPDITATGYCAVFLIIISNFYAVQDPLCRRDLIWPHDHQDVLRGEDTVLGQDIQYRMTGKEGSGEVDQVRDHTVIGIGPEARKLKTVAGLFLFLLARLRILNGIESGAVGIILSVRTITDDEDLYIFE